MTVCVTLPGLQCLFMLEKGAEFTTPLGCEQAAESVHRDIHPCHSYVPGCQWRAYISE